MMTEQLARFPNEFSLLIGRKTRHSLVHFEIHLKTLLRIFDIAETRLVGEYFTKSKVTEEIEQIKYNANGTLIGSISNGTFRIWSESNDILKLDPKLTKGSVLSSLHWKGVASLDLIAA